MTGQLIRVNIGCGRTPTPGFRNFDNSMSVKLARRPLLVRFLSQFGLLGEDQLKFIEFARNGSIQWADAIRRIPLDDGSAELVYSSHMLEHFDRREARQFLTEVRRVLADGGVIRLVLPDLGKLIERYNISGDADSFMESTLLVKPRPQSLREKVVSLVAGDRNHLWMYDAASLCKLLTDLGFQGVRTLSPGETTFSNPGELDLAERAHESLYVEARK